VPAASLSLSVCFRTNLFDKLANIFRVPDLRKRVLFTLASWPSTAWDSHCPRRASRHKLAALLSGVAVPSRLY